MYVFDDSIEIAMEQFLLVFYSGVHENQTWVMRSYVQRALEKNDQGRQLLSTEVFYEIFRNVLIEIVYDY